MPTARPVRVAFRRSFLGGAAFRAAVKTPLLDWLVQASSHPRVQSATAQLLAQL